MPEGPELHVSGWLVDRFSKGRIYSGKVEKSAVSTKNPDVDWDEPSYTITTSTRGKEIRLTLTSVDCDEVLAKNAKTKAKKCGSQTKKIMHIKFNFGMSGKFVFYGKSEMDKHCHLNFYTRDEDMVLSFNDYRRFGRWEVTEEWGKDRGPCIILEYELFRKNVLENLKGNELNKPVCQVLLNQKYFNGIGNYLRAEILYRLSIPPFVSMRSVLDPIREIEEAGIKTEDDLLKLCHTVPNEVVRLEGGLKYIYDPENKEEDYQTFSDWLQCYYQEGMTNLVDHQGRTIWFDGPAGPLKPKDSKTRDKVRRKKKAEAVKTEEEPVTVKKVKKEPVTVKKVKKEPQEKEEEQITESKTKSKGKSKTTKMTRKQLAKNKVSPKTEEPKKSPKVKREQKVIDRPIGSRRQPRRSCTQNQG